MKKIGSWLVMLLLSVVMATAQGSGQNILKERLVAPADPVAYSDTVAEAMRLFNSGNQFVEAAAKFRSALDQYQLDGLIWIYYGHSLRAAGKPKEAIPAYQKGLELRSSWQEMSTYYWLARAYLETGDKENAYRSLDTLVFHEPYVSRQLLYNDAAFASIKDEPRFLKIAGRIDTSKMSRTEGWRTDIDFLVSEIKRVNHKYRIEPLPKEFMERYDRLKRDVPRLTDDEIFAGMGHMIAALHQGHMSLSPTPDSKLMPLKTLPLQFYSFPEGIYVVGADEKYQDLVGLQVLKIEQTPPAEILRRIEELLSVENPIKAMWSGMRPLGTLQYLRGLGVVKPGVEDVKLTFRSKDGKEFERVVGVVGREQNRKLVPPKGPAAPLFTKDVASAHWFEQVPNEDAVFVQLNQVTNDKDETLEAFGLRLRKYLNDTPTKNVILDVRHNNGGNTFLYPELLRTLIAHTTKEGNRLYVIIGRGVYSATGNLITDLERLANPVFVGEPSGGFGNQDGDEALVALPYSGVRGTLTTIWWQLSHPWDQRRSIQPNVPVQLTAEAYFAGRDPALETILRLIKRP